MFSIRRNTVVELAITSLLKLEYIFHLSKPSLLLLEIHEYKLYIKEERIIYIDLYMYKQTNKLSMFFE